MIFDNIDLARFDKLKDMKIRLNKSDINPKSNAFEQQVPRLKLKFRDRVISDYVAK